MGILPLGRPVDLPALCPSRLTKSPGELSDVVSSCTQSEQIHTYNVQVYGINIRVNKQVNIQVTKQVNIQIFTSEHTAE